MATTWIGRPGSSRPAAISIGACCVTSGSSPTSPRSAAPRRSTSRRCHSCPPTRAAARPPGLGRWGAFELLQKIGEGAFGDVFRARDALHRDVALKLLRASQRHVHEPAQRPHPARRPRPRPRAPSERRHGLWRRRARRPRRPVDGVHRGPHARGAAAVPGTVRRARSRARRPRAVPRGRRRPRRRDSSIATSRRRT